MEKQEGSLLIVDDDPSYRAMLRHYLAPHGFHITEAEDGPRALELVGRQEFEAAARVQQARLPQAPPPLAGVTFAWHYKPCAGLAGDLLNVVPLDDRRVALYVLDVVDHGVKAALLAVMINRVLARLLAAP